MNLPFPITDTHCHLGLLKTDKTGDLVAVLQQAKQLGVTRWFNIAITPDDWAQQMAWSEQHEGIFQSIGIHPCHAEDQADEEQWRAALSHPKTIAVGETGLDYYHESKEAVGALQAERFVQQVAYAKQYDKPLIIHTRAARADTIALLKSEQASAVGGVIHCFTEDWATAKAALDLGFYLSFTGIVTFKQATEVQAVAKRVPQDRLLVETDAPYLTPVPHRGKANQPGFTRHVLEFLAELRGEDVVQLNEQLHLNTQRLFFERG